MTLSEQFANVNNSNKTSHKKINKKKYKLKGGGQSSSSKNPHKKKKSNRKTSCFGCQQRVATNNYSNIPNVIGFNNYEEIEKQLKPGKSKTIVHRNRLNKNFLCDNRIFLL
jgi:hypothetical protein